MEVHSKTSTGAGPGRPGSLTEPGNARRREQQPRDTVIPMADNDLDATIERLNNLGHLSAGVGHHVINAFSAIVSNAELLRLNPPLPMATDPAVLAEMIVQTALEAATVARRLIDYTRPLTSIDPRQAAFEPSTIALEKLVADVVAEEQAAGPAAVHWHTELA